MLKIYLLAFSFTCFELIISSKASDSDRFLNEIFSSKSSSDDDSMTLEEFNSIWDDIIKNEKQKCYSTNDLFSVYNISNVIRKKDFPYLSTALIWQLVEPNCNQSVKNQTCEPNSEKNYWYGILSIVLTWAISMFNVFILSLYVSRRPKAKSTGSLISVLSALAISTLLADVLLHIFPTIIGHHDHDLHDNLDHKVNQSNHNNVLHIYRNSSHNQEEESKKFLWKMSVTLSTVFLLFFLETLAEHNHKHNDDSHNQIASDNIELKKNGLIPVLSDKKFKFTNQLKIIGSHGWVAWFGDIIHKLVDGLSIGAAFSESLNSGISLSIANLLHEIPHELGDYSVLRSAGFSNWTIFFLNSTCSLFSLISYLIISSVKADKELGKWMLAVTAGVFFYLALGVMMPRLKQAFEKNENGKRNWFIISLILFMFIFGWVIMFLLAFFENDIQIDVGC